METDFILLSDADLHLEEGFPQDSLGWITLRDFREAKQRGLTNPSVLYETFRLFSGHPDLKNYTEIVLITTLFSQ